MELGLKPGSDAKVPPRITGFFISLLDMWRLLISLSEGTSRSYYSHLVSGTFSPNIF